MNWTELESDTILRLREHFEKNVRHAMIGQGVKNKNEFFKILTEFDNDDRNERIARERANKDNSQNPNKSADNSKNWTPRNVNAIRTHSTPKNQSNPIKTNFPEQTKGEKPKNKQKNINKKITDQYDRDIGILEIHLDDDKTVSKENPGNAN